MEKYLKKAYAKIEGYRHVVNGIFEVNKKDKITNDIFEDFINLYKLRKVEEIQKSHAEITRAYQKKIDEIRKEVDKLTLERKKVLREENEKFLEAKRKGLPALVNYKLSRCNQRQKEKWMKEKIRLDYISAMREVEESYAVKYWTTLENTQKGQAHGIRPAPKYRFMSFGSQSSQKTKIISAGSNVALADREIKKIDEFVNKLNRGLAVLKSRKPLSTEYIESLEKAGLQLYEKIYVGSSRLELMTTIPLYDFEEKIKYMNELLTEAKQKRASWDRARKANKNILFSA